MISQPFWGNLGNSTCTSPRYVYAHYHAINVYLLQFERGIVTTPVLARAHREKKKLLRVARSSRSASGGKTLTAFQVLYKSEN